MLRYGNGTVYVYTTMSQRFTTIKTSKNALSCLRLAAALSGERQYALMERLLVAEVERLQQKVSNQRGSQRCY